MRGRAHGAAAGAYAGGYRKSGTALAETVRVWYAWLLIQLYSSSTT